ncbi:hypothetical protein ASPCAL08534 [Aspergillus calidoustus]|uniref:Helicase ATP-binding domain-containing protein n=1 Tax=Aspergillus calidoustus TaxID=454130 RepID=A0A0U5GRT1_ASPCI|nr:hypothetical protein ASPCAL08534 [Aspergillus calidoustus]
MRHTKSTKRRIWEVEEGWESPSKRQEPDANTSLRPPLFPSSETSPSPSDPSYCHSHSHSPLPSPFIFDTFDNYVGQTHNAGGPLPPINSTSGDEMHWDSTVGETRTEPDIVCFGMLCDVKARLKDDVQILEGTFGITHNSSETLWRLSMIEKDNHIALQHTAGKDFAVLNSKITRLMHALSHLDKLQYEVLVSGNELSEAISTWACRGKTDDFHVNIVVYGLQVYRDEIGFVLSSSDWYLQVPWQIPAGIPYDNPQFWDLGQSVEPPQTQCDLAVNPKASAMTEAAIILNSLDQTSFLSPAVIDDRITQSLLSHQQTGVNFIAQREGWQPSSFFSLWDSRSRADMDFYEHKITGTRSSTKPQETVGGILADEMGLGKTLTLLSAIVGSLSSSQSWTATEPAALGLQRSMTRVGATLVIVPSVLIMEQWCQEIRRHVPGLFAWLKRLTHHRHVCTSSLQVMKYHGSTRAKDGQSFSHYDLVLSTYGTVSREFASGNSQLYEAQWFRLVLDEAHNIRDQSTRQFRAMSSLPAKFRWCLTGTPIQNSLEDLGSLIRFLRIPHLDTTKFREHILRPAEKGQEIGFANLRTLLRSICLRRTKEVLHFAEPSKVLREITLTPDEKCAYSRIVEDTNMEVEKAVCEGRHQDARRQVFKVILKLRRLCAYGTFYRPQEASNSQEELFALLQQSNTANCTTCSCDVASIDDSSHPAFGAFTQCLHLLCADCNARYNEDMKQADVLTSNKKRRTKFICPICGQNVTAKGGKGGDPATQPNDMDIDMIDNGYSAKLSCLLDDISQHYVNDKM